MDYKYFKNAVEFAKKIMKETIWPGDIVLDCTVGKGNDTLLLAELVGPLGKIYGFDVQIDALDHTKKRLKEKGLANRVRLIHDGHENISNYIKDEKIKLVVFNLGYLPTGDHNIVTKPETTIQGIKTSLELLDQNGVLLVTSYTGHIGGLEEKKIIEKFLYELNQKKYSVLKFQFINQINNPPILYGVEKLN